jgi:hypothetical protein
MMVLWFKRTSTCRHVGATPCCACCPPCARGRALLPQATWKLAVAAAPSNRGLTPERYNKFGRDHFYQIPESPVGVVGAWPGAAGGVLLDPPPLEALTTGRRHAAGVSHTG